MADYKKMYTVLCGAIDDVLDDLSSIPLAYPYACRLGTALRQAEDIYIETTPYASDTQREKVIQLNLDKFPQD